MATFTWHNTFETHPCCWMYSTGFLKLLSNISLYVSTTDCLWIHLLIGIWVVSNFRLSWTKYWGLQNRRLWWTCFHLYFCDQSTYTLNRLLSTVWSQVCVSHFCIWQANCSSTICYWTNLACLKINWPHLFGSISKLLSSIDICFFLYANVMLFWLTKISSKSWNQIV